ncbi:hypothetical protein RFI_32811 [Reticulomyxa filosa]|uniref:Uncharacterized protein n=1 Tax=Reticulomyxa filosa TaxID=46433 RepID=X6LTY2_RETFI|nr:hypothetical protein RFI_32811 [Reticulomyxa filosa]|eukprot:ETO04587.1 hypothetical protein RFI_32811 [Reticulomyxa filosa]
MQQKKMKRKLRGRNRCYVMKVLQKWDEDGIRIGQNYVFIDYSRFCRQQFHQLCVQNLADYTHFVHTSPKLFYITIDDNDKTTDANNSHTYLLPFNFYHDEFVQICREEMNSLSNAIQYIVFGQFVNFSIESKGTNANGWNIYDILRNDDTNQKKSQLGNKTLFKKYLLKKKKLSK